MRSPYVGLSIGDANGPRPFECENFSRRKPMSQPEQYDVLIFGSGAGGKLLAWHMAGSGRRTAVVERKWIGGSCPNIACLPSKNVVRSAEVAHLAPHAPQFGTMTGPL